MIETFQNIPFLTRLREKESPGKWKDSVETVLTSRDAKGGRRSQF